MNNRISRRKLITAGVASAAGLTGLAAASVHMAGQNGLLTPDTWGRYGPGEFLTYASQRLLTSHSLAREFSPSQISEKPFSTSGIPKDADYQLQLKDGFKDWQLAVSGMVSRPLTLSVADLQGYPSRSQITQVICEEGWNYIAQWTGVPLSHILELAGVAPAARYVVYFSLQKGWDSSIDMADALHPQTLLAYGMNGANLPPAHGGPIRIRVPRQLGYKSVKYLTRLVVTDTLEHYYQTGDYSWYAGI